MLSTGYSLDKNRLCFAGFEVGSANSTTFERLWNRIITTNDIKMSCTDGKPVYKEFFKYDADIKHVIIKPETCLVESYNGTILLCFTEKQNVTQNQQKC